MMRRAIILRGFTLIELMVTIAIAGLLILMVAPSFQDMILTQRVRGVSAQLNTDLQYSRAQAVSSNRYTLVTPLSDDTQTCYTIYQTEAFTGDICDCRNGAGSACTFPGGSAVPGYSEVKTVTVPKSSGVQLTWPADQTQTFGFDYVTGGLMATTSDSRLKAAEKIQIDASADAARSLSSRVIQTGRSRICGSSDAAVQRMQVAAC